VALLYLSLFDLVAKMRLAKINNHVAERTSNNRPSILIAQAGIPCPVSKFTAASPLSAGVVSPACQT